MKAVALALAFLFTLAAAAAPCPKDIRGRDVPLGRGAPALVFYANRHTRDLLRSTAFDFAYDVKAAKPIVLVRIDVSDLPGFLRGYVRGQVRESYVKSVAHMRQKFVDHGETPPANLEDHVYFVVDEDGDGRRELGMKSGFSQAKLSIVDAAGKVVTTVPFPQERDEAAKAVLRTARR